ncbi:flagellar hook-associated protein [Leminorella grimontii]|uniref:flagellar hook-associated protein n=1 Tax=Leminorella grimontii TaxID=82981 RepID=UPI00321F64A7
MQIGFNSSSLTGSGALTPSSVLSQTANVEKTAVVEAQQATADYPASPLISTRPQRYSVQLNDQLTALQQADRYLGQLEQKLVDYRHSARRGGDISVAKNSAQEIEKLLQNRTTLCGGTVDRQLKPVLQGQAQVVFQAPRLAQALSKPESRETLLFSVQDGGKTRLSAVSVDGEMAPRQYQTVVNNALRRVGVQKVSVSGKLSGDAFATAETDWPQLKASFSVKGEGVRFDGEPTMIETAAEPALSETLQTAMSTSGASANQAIQSALEQISEQRLGLATQQEKARRLVDGMARFPQTQSAIDASSALAGQLDEASHNYQVLQQAVNGQARLSHLTVRSLLS